MATQQPQNLLAKIDSSPRARAAVAKALAEMKQPPKTQPQDGKGMQTGKPNG